MENETTITFMIDGVEWRAVVFDEAVKLAEKQKALICKVLGAER